MERDRAVQLERDRVRRSRVPQERQELLQRGRPHTQKPKLEFREPFLFEAEHNGIYSFVCDKVARRVGVWDCAVRVIPSNELLPHDQDFNIVRWI